MVGPAPSLFLRDLIREILAEIWRDDTLARADQRGFSMGFFLGELINLIERI